MGVGAGFGAGAGVDVHILISGVGAGVNFFSQTPQPWKVFLPVHVRVIKTSKGNLINFPMLFLIFVQWLPIQLTN